jgi:hypothetical protein
MNGVHKVQEKVSGSHLSQDPILVVCSPPQMYSGHSIKKRKEKLKKKKKGDSMRRLIRPPVLKRQMPLRCTLDTIVSSSIGSLKGALIFTYLACIGN